MAGISGRGPVSMHAVCASVEENVDDGRMTPTDGDVRLSQHPACFPRF